MPLLHTLCLAAVLAVSQAAQPRAQARDTPPKIQVTTCVANTDTKYQVPGTNGRTARFVETVVVSDARPDRRVFLAWANNNGAASSVTHSFSSNCGKLHHIGLGVVNDLVLDLTHISSGRKLTQRADANGVATFAVPVDKCGKFFYQGFDWINNRNCQTTPLGNIHFVPPPPPLPAAAGAGVSCSIGLFDINDIGGDQEAEWNWLTGAADADAPHAARTMSVFCWGEAVNQYMIASGNPPLGPDEKAAFTQDAVGWDAAGNNDGLLQYSEQP